MRLTGPRDVAPLNRREPLIRAHWTAGAPKAVTVGSLIGRRGSRHLPNRDQRSQFARFYVARLMPTNIPLCRRFVTVDARDRTTENRGVPGSSPGLAITKARMVAGFSAFWLVRTRSKSPAHSGDEKETAAEEHGPTGLGEPREPASALGFRHDSNFRPHDVLSCAPEFERHVGVGDRFGVLRPSHALGRCRRRWKTDPPSPVEI
jgi:hypothetical protein